MSAFLTAVIILLVSVVSFVVVIGICMIFIIWSADPDKIAEIIRLKKIADLANKNANNTFNDEQARVECEANPQIKKHIVYTDDKGFKIRYSVRMSAKLAAFGFC